MHAFLLLIGQIIWAHLVLSFFSFIIFRQKRNEDAFEIPNMSAISWEVYIASDFTKNFIFSTTLRLLAYLDLPNLGAFITGHTSALNYLQIVEKGHCITKINSIYVSINVR